MNTALIATKDFFDGPVASEAVISPDGGRIAYLAPEQGRMNMWVRDLADGDENWHGGEAEYLVKNDEGHGYQNPENLIEMYDRIEAFLARHLSGRVTGGDA